MDMKKSVKHPGIILSEIIDSKGLSQRDLSLELAVAPSLLNGILKGKRNLTPTIVISLEAMGVIDSASSLLKAQVRYSLELAKNDIATSNKVARLNEWKKIGEIVPVSFFKQDLNLNIVNSDDIAKIYNIYGVTNYKELQNLVNGYELSHFRKSIKLESEKNNLIAWSVLAKYKASTQKLKKTFNKNSSEELINELKRVFSKNTNTISNTKKVLNKYGIKFLVLDRPTKTHADGKSFICDNGSPVIVLSLKYKRLDNFAFTLLHEIYHVYNHLFSEKYNNSISNENNDLMELEADRYARNMLIPVELWEDFIYTNDSFTDNVIYDFSDTYHIHPGIVRGRICHENPEYYRKRTSISKANILDES